MQQLKRKLQHMGTNTNKSKNNLKYKEMLNKNNNATHATIQKTKIHKKTNEKHVNNWIINFKK